MGAAIPVRHKGFAGLDLEIDLLNEKRAVTGATWTRSVKF